MKDENSFSFEDKLRRIREISEKMQGGRLGFDENVALFKEGMKLTEECRRYLDESEMLIKKLIEGENGPEEVPFEG